MYRVSHSYNNVNSLNIENRKLPVGFVYMTKRVIVLDVGLLGRNFKCLDKGKRIWCCFEVPIVRTHKFGSLLRLTDCLTLIAIVDIIGCHCEQCLLRLLQICSTLFDPYD